MGQKQSQGTNNNIVHALSADKTYQAGYKQRPQAVSSACPCYICCESQSLGLVSNSQWYSSLQRSTQAGLTLEIAISPGEFGADNEGIWLSGARCPICPICPLIIPFPHPCYPFIVCCQCYKLYGTTAKIPWKDITVGTETRAQVKAQHIFSSDSSVAVIPVKVGFHRIYITPHVWQLLAKQNKQHGIQTEKEDKNVETSAKLVLAATAVLPSENMKAWMVVPAAAPAKTYYRNVDTNAVAWNWSAPLPVDATRKEEKNKI